MFLLIDKPKGMTSHDVVNKVRSVSGKRKVGHGGTLDPNATGLLVVGIGRKATKKLGKLSKETKKIYEAQILLGEEKDTDDVEGITISRAKGFLSPSTNEIENILKTYVGKQKQLPPSYSAVKIKGKKAYEIARKGESVVLKKREIEIFSIELVRYKYPILEIITTVSSGTYIRSLARDIGRRLGCGAYLNNLRRTEIEKYNIDQAVNINFLTKENWRRLVIAI